MVAVLGALAYYGYRTVRSQDSRITQMFGEPSGEINGERPRPASRRRRKQSARPGRRLAGHRPAYDKAGGPSFRRCQGNSPVRGTTTTQQLHQQITAEMNARTSPLDARLRQVESERRASVTRSLSSRRMSSKSSTPRGTSRTDRDLSAVREQEQSNARDVNALSQRLDRQRIDFELAKGQTKELAPGISLRIRGVNVSRSRYHGTFKRYRKLTGRCGFVTRARTNQSVSSLKMAEIPTIWWLPMWLRRA